MPHVIEKPNRIAIYPDYHERYYDREVLKTFQQLAAHLGYKLTKTRGTIQATHNQELVGEYLPDKSEAWLKPQPTPVPQLKEFIEIISEQITDDPHILNEMAAKTFTCWDDNDPACRMEKDSFGVPKLDRPSFRRQDKRQIIQHSPQVEDWLNKATERYNIHWAVVYLEPKPEMKHGDEDWPAYQAYGKQKGTEALAQFTGDDLAKSLQIDERNTVVYIKPTSRVHTLSPWQQIHNIGHACWQHCLKQRSGFEKALTSIVAKLQQQAYDKAGQAPTRAEITVMLARLLDVHSFQRIFLLQPGDLQQTQKSLNTAIGSFDEAMYELFAVFLRNGGRIPLRGRGPVGRAPGKVQTPDRRGRMTPNQEVAALGVRPWVWETLASDAAAWAEAAKKLELIVVTALKNCTWSAAGGPIYATTGTLTTEP